MQKRNSMGLGAMVCAIIGGVFGLFGAIGGFACAEAIRIGAAFMGDGGLYQWGAIIAAVLLLIGSALVIAGGVLARNGKMVGAILCWVSFILPIIGIVLVAIPYGFGGALIVIIPNMFALILMLLAAILGTVGALNAKKGGGGVPPQSGGYPPQGEGYPPQGGGYPPQGGGYPPNYPQ